MKLVTYGIGRERFVGSVVADGGIVVDLAASEAELAASEGREARGLFGDMLSLLDAGGAGLRAAKQVARFAEEPAGRYGRRTAWSSGRKRKAQGAGAESPKGVLPGGKLPGTILKRAAEKWPSRTGKRRGFS